MWKPIGGVVGTNPDCTKRRTIKSIFAITVTLAEWCSCQPQEELEEDLYDQDCGAQHPRNLLRHWPCGIQEQLVDRQ